MDDFDVSAYANMYTSASIHYPHTHPASALEPVDLCMNASVILLQWTMTWWRSPSPPKPKVWRLLLFRLKCVVGLVRTPHQLFFSPVGQVARVIDRCRQAPASADPIPPPLSKTCGGGESDPHATRADRPGPGHAHQPPYCRRPAGGQRGGRPFTPHQPSIPSRPCWASQTMAHRKASARGGSPPSFGGARGGARGGV